MEREPNTQYVLSLSYGKDSIACIQAIKELGYPLDRIVHAEVWATDTIPADLPPMVEFKAYADRIIKERYGIEVEHVCAMNKDGTKKTYEQLFYHIPVRRTKKVTHPSEVSGGGESYNGLRTGFPCQQHAWCNSKLKVQILQSSRIPAPDNRMVQKSQRQEHRPIHSEEQIGVGSTDSAIPSDRSAKTSRRKRWTAGNGTGGVRSTVTAQKRDYISDSRSSGDNGVPAISRGVFSDTAVQGGRVNTVQYLGIAADEPERIARHIVKPRIVLPLVDIGWEEAYCRKWCEENNLLSPIYTTSARGGCWFCHNQGVEQLRLLRKMYPDLWQILLKWDSDSPTTFHADGHTVHDFEKRFAMEDAGLIQKGKPFKWSMLDDDIHQLSLF